MKTLFCLLSFVLLVPPTTACAGSATDNQELLPIQRKIMRLIARRDQTLTGAGAPRHARLSHCFAPGTPESYIQQVTAQAGGPSLHFRLDDAPSHWEFTATDGSAINRGDPITLTWNIVPDGTPVPPLGGGANAPSDLRARLDELYGNEAVWLPLFQQVFDRWGELTGVTYVHETNDDMAAFTSQTIGGDAAPGILGTRADVRIGGRALDGNFNTLGFNFGAPNGEMVLDTDDNAFENFANNSRLLRNTVSHEHGHGLSLNHSCPENETKIMEPTVPDTVDGPQHDDILGAQRQHGDPREGNDTFGEATDLGLVADGAVTVTTVLGGDILSLDGNDDVDIFKFTISEAGRNASVTLRPVGQAYLEAAQNQNGTCPPGVMIDSRTHQDLNIEIIGADASTVLGIANVNPAGQNETLIDIPLAGGTGPFFIRVFGGADDNVQMYDIDLTVGAGQTGTLHHFNFDPVASPQVVQQAFSVGIDAVDIFNGPVSPFTGSVNLSVVARETILITEIDPGSTDRVEFCNVSDRTIDVSGWQILVYDSTSGPAPDSTTTLPALSSMAPDGVFTLTENGNAPGALPGLFSGTDIDWAHNSGAISVLLLNDQGEVVDFATLGDNASITTPAAIPAEEWTGPGIANAASDTYQRTGSADSNTNADWGNTTSTFGSKNSGLTSPFPDRSIAFSPASTGSFSSGMGSVNLTFTEPGDKIVLKADDGSGHTGYSAPFDVELVNDISAELSVAPTSVRIGETITYTATVRNIGPSDATQVTLTDMLPANTAFVSAVSSQGSVGENAGTVTATLGTIVGGGSATVTINLTAGATGTVINTVTATRGETDPFTPNNTASVSVLVVQGPDSVEEFNAFTGMAGSFPADADNDTGGQFEMINFSSSTTDGGFRIDTTTSQNGRGLTFTSAEQNGMRSSSDISPGDYTTPAHMISFWFRFSAATVDGSDHFGYLFAAYNQAPEDNTSYAYQVEAGIQADGQHGVQVVIPSSFVPSESPVGNFTVDFIPTTPDQWHRCIIHYTAASDTSETDGAFKIWIDPTSGSSVPHVSLPNESFAVASPNGVGPFGRYGFGRSVGFPMDTAGPTMFIDSVGSWDGHGAAGVNDLQAGVDFLNASIPNLAIAATSASKAEGDSGNTQFGFTVTRTGPNAVATTVDFAVTGSGNNAAQADDFGGALPTGSVNFAPDETSKSIPINVSGDTDIEPSEEFTVTISVPAGGVIINTPTATGTIQNDDMSAAMFDFGDAPSSFPTLIANDGARHAIVMGAPLLGSEIDAEADGQQDSNAQGDDGADAPDDEDGVSTPTLLVGQTISIPINVTGASGRLDAWIDFNQDGDWNDPDEQIATDLPVATGSTTLMLAVPSGAVTGQTFARFRVSTAGQLSPTGVAADGEVEDHRILVVSGPLPATDHVSIPAPNQSGAVEIVYQGVSGTTYLVQTSTDLSVWTTIATVTADPNGVIFHKQTGVGSMSRLFYRTQEQ